jgi:DNA-directed RNA polymerase subunit F
MGRSERVTRAEVSRDVYKLFLEEIYRIKDHLGEQDVDVNIVEINPRSLTNKMRTILSKFRV